MACFKAFAQNRASNRRLPLYQAADVHRYSSETTLVRRTPTPNTRARAKRNLPPLAALKQARATHFSDKWREKFRPLFLQSAPARQKQEVPRPARCESKPQSDSVKRGELSWATALQR
jgi:hypothetical protein